jgi:hypothetical protein
MTAPQQPPPQQPPPSTGQLAIASAAVLAVAPTVGAAVLLLKTRMAEEHIEQLALRGALDVVMGHPPDATGFYGPATRYMSQLNLMRRAQFLVASARRLQGSVLQARSHNANIARAFADQLAAERRYYGQHKMAVWQRERAAAQVDTAGREYGRLLGWYSVNDSHTSPECRAAHRHNFYADQPPLIGYPGAVHPACRCMPGPPIPGAALVPAGRRSYSRAA